MLIGLTIRDIVLVDQLDLEFAPGLWTLTGETGAGKSILLDSLGLATGARADKGLVRHGASQGVVSAVFTVPPKHPVWSTLSDQGLESGEDLILRRVQGADGRSRAFINDQPVSINLLRQVGESLLEIHGQHDDRGLLNPSAHRALLDAFGGLDARVTKCMLAFEAWRGAEEALAAKKAQIEKAATDEDYLRHVMAELDELGPELEEEDALSSQRTAMMNAEKVSSELEQAVQAMTGKDGLEKKLSAALRSLEMAAQKVPGTLESVVGALDRALMEAGEARASLEQAIHDHVFDQQKLEDIEERLFALRALARKHKVSVDQLLPLRDEFATQLQSIETGQADVSALEDAVREARASYYALAKDLHGRRVKAAKKLDQAVAKELKPLKLERATFTTVIEDLPDAKPNAHGLDRVHFMIATNPGAPLGALTEIASGGELARFILALKVSLATQGELTTMIFDEVDRGVGGAVSDAVGERLARLAETAQVLVVTHSPQVAARASHHLHVAKSVTKAGATRTQVEPLDDDARQEEIARMLSAAEVTSEARAAAARLLSVEDNLKTGTAG